MPYYQIDVTFTGDDSFMVFADSKEEAEEMSREMYDYSEFASDKVCDFVFTASETTEEQDDSANH